MKKASLHLFKNAVNTNVTVYDESDETGNITPRLIRLMNICLYNLDNRTFYEEGWEAPQADIYQVEDEIQQKVPSCLPPHKTHFLVARGREYNILGAY